MTFNADFDIISLRIEIKYVPYYFLWNVMLPCLCIGARKQVKKV